MTITVSIDDEHAFTAPLFVRRLQEIFWSLQFLDGPRGISLLSIVVHNIHRIEFGGTVQALGGIPILNGHVSSQSKLIVFIQIHDLILVSALVSLDIR